MKIEEMPTQEYWGKYDWGQVFGTNSYSSPSAEFAGKSGPAGVPKPADVEKVLWIISDSPEGYGSVDFSGLFRLTEGRFAMCEAWADTTGWGCQDGVYWKIGPTLESVWNELTESKRPALDSLPM
jgi:hypothetical protein